MQLEKNTILKRGDDIVFNTLDDDIIMMSMKNGEYYGLDAIGTWIWDKIESPVSFEGLIKAIMLEFEVSEEDCINDVKDFLVSMNEKELILFE